MLSSVQSTVMTRTMILISLFCWMSPNAILHHHSKATLQVHRMCWLWKFMIYSKLLIFQSIYHVMLLHKIEKRAFVIVNKLYPRHHLCLRMLSVSLKRNKNGWAFGVFQFLKLLNPQSKTFSCYQLMSFHCFQAVNLNTLWDIQNRFKFFSPSGKLFLWLLGWGSFLKASHGGKQ